MNKLKINEQFTACEALPDDEIFGGYPFAWNITALEAWIAEHREEVAYSTVTISRAETTIDSGNLNEQHIPTVDLAKPLIVVRLRPEYYRLIDGHHRVAKARRNGVAELPAYYLSEEQHRSFFIHAESDRLYVEYWNEKLQMVERYGAAFPKIGEMVI